MKKTFAVIAVIILVFSFNQLFASDYYEKGNTFFTVKAGVTIPCFATFMNDSEVGTKTLPDEMQAKVGGYGSLSYQVFIIPELALGGEIGYGFNYTQSDKILTTVPMIARMSYLPVQTGKFDLSLNPSLGFSYNRYNDTKFIMPFASITCCPTFYIGNNWGLGIDLGMWFNAELHSGELKKDNSFAGFIPATFALIYRK